MILEDFFISSCKGWTCGSCDVSGLSDVEEYVKARIKSSAPDAQVKLIHTYDEAFCARTGSSVGIGAGLVMKYYSQAVNFLLDAEASPSDTRTRPHTSPSDTQTRPH